MAHLQLPFLRDRRKSLLDRLVVLFILAGVVPALLVGTVAHHRAKVALDSAHDLAQASLVLSVERRLESIRDNQKVGIERYFQTIIDQVVTFSSDPAVMESAIQFCEAFPAFRSESAWDEERVRASANSLAEFYETQFGDRYAKEQPGRSIDLPRLYSGLSDDAIALQSAYMVENPAPLGSKHQLDRDTGDSRYAQAHAAFQPMARDYQERFGYYDIFIVDAQSGDVVYSVFKEIDFGTRLLADGVHAESGLGAAFRAGLELEHTSDFALIDFAPYLPSYGAPASFIASPVTVGGKTAAVVIFQLPLDRISVTMSVRSGLGETGEAYLVGPDGRMRSDSYRDPITRTVAASFDESLDPEYGRVLTAGAQAAAAGEVGIIRHENYAGHAALCAYTPVNVAGLRWSLLTEIEDSEAFHGLVQMESADKAARRKLSTIVALVLLIAAILVGLLAVVEARKIMEPIISTEKVLVSAARGDLTHRVDIDTDDEVGRMASALNEMIDGVATALQGDKIDWQVVAGQRAELDQVASLVKSCSLGLLFVDTNGNIQYVNPQAERRFDEHRSLLKGSTQALGKAAVTLYPTAAEGRSALSCSEGAVATRVETENEVFDMLTTCAIAEDGQRIGHVITMDRTTRAVQSARRTEELQQAELEQTARLHREAQELLRSVTEASAGDLTVTMPKVTDASLSDIGAGIDSLLAGFRDQMSLILATGGELNESAGELRSISEVMGQAAMTTTNEAARASTTSSDLTGRVATVVSSAIELEASIVEINGNATEAVAVANQAVEQALATSDRVQQLRATSHEIGDVIQIIGGIAAQTNLLALNAAIEAARAGVNGKGFAVVANEVKALAAETSSATEVVSQRIETMQLAASEVTEQIGAFSETVNSICTTQTEIASAVGQQTSATRAIGESAGNASKETSDISRSIADVATQASETNEGAHRTSASAGRVEEAAMRLNRIVASFKID